MQSELESEDRAKLAEVRDALQQVPSQRRHLIPVLQRVQQTLSYLPTDAIDLVAKHFNLTPSDVYGVATFYNQFRFNPPGRHPVRVCMGTACHVKGGDVILEHFERKLEIKEGETTADREFSIDRVACVGCCALAPVALMGETLHGHMMTSKVEGLILRVKIEKEKAERERLQNERLEKSASIKGASPVGASPVGATTK
ncbi:MAG: NADH-quinone oxidoreductase subunit NuoE [Desulfosarcinaceae bacterium]|jgi:NADH-quinone oxidoreductase subunit E